MWNSPSHFSQIRILLLSSLRQHTLHASHGEYGLQRIQC